MQRFLLPLLVCALLISGQAHARQAAESSVPAPPVVPDVPTLDKVQALRPEEDVLELYRFQNPITVDPNRFNKAYDTGITPQDMALHYGGYVNYGINKGLYETWKGFKKVTGMRPQIQFVTARPPPLSEEQTRRAAKGLEPGQETGAGE